MRSNDLRALMWAEACDLLDQADRLHRQFFRLGGEGGPLAWEPPIDVFESNRSLRVVVALPGVAPEDVAIAFRDGFLIVTGERPLPAERNCVIHRVEIPQGRFERQIGLPSGRFELGRHDLENGCLTIVLRKLD
jgi:HSP20 family protein